MRSTPELLDEIRRLVAAHARPTLDTPIDGLLLSRVETASAPDHSLTEPLLVVMAQGGKRHLVGNRVHEHRAGQYLLVTADLPVTGHFIDVSPQAPSLAMGLVLRPATIAPLLLEAPAQRWSRTTVALPAMAIGGAGPDLLDAVVRMLRMLDRPARHTTPSLTLGGRGPQPGSERLRPVGRCLGSNPLVGRATRRWGLAAPGVAGLIVTVRRWPSGRRACWLAKLGGRRPGHRRARRRRAR